MDVTEPQNHYKRVEPDDPTRCQGVRGETGQCNFEAQLLSNGKRAKYCRMHGAAIAEKSVQTQARRLYSLTKWQGQVDDLRANGEGVHLEEELAILRMTLQTALNKYEEVELITQSGQISSLCAQIQSILVANVKLKSQLGALLDRATIDKLAVGLVAIMSEYLPQDKLDDVSSKVAGLIAEAVSKRESL